MEAGDSEDQDLLERTDMLSKFRVVSRVSKVGKQAGKQVNKGRRRKKKVKDGVVVFKGHPSWSIVLAFQVSTDISDVIRLVPGRESSSSIECRWD